MMKFEKKYYIIYNILYKNILLFYSDKNSHIYKHLKSSSACREACNENCFAVLDSAGTAYKRKIKEVLHIMWEGPNLNKQLNHYNISLNF